MDFKELLEMQFEVAAKNFIYEKKKLGLEVKSHEILVVLLKVMTAWIFLSIFLAIGCIFLLPLINKAQILCCMSPGLLFLISILPPMKWIFGFIIFSNYNVFKSLRGEYNNEN